MSPRPAKNNTTSPAPALTQPRTTPEVKATRQVTSARIEADLETFYQAGGHIEVLGVPSTGKAATPHSAPARARNSRRGSSV